ncbi:MAG: wax ester/triacylglycerol synthase family O-acyltransferase, partial [Acidimicrobiales bacterium]|nr:wax ester/triacylglycerol synthase family O-acyltransferase [Acidimicrobiales bacterium]
MRRLAGSDAGFLFIESESQTSTCVDLAVLAPASDGRGPLTLAELRDHVAVRLDQVPSFRWRLEEVPLGVNHPLWVEDADFDLGYHLRHATVAAPGGPAELDALVAEQLPGLLDRRHPLWQIVLVDGLADGRQALIYRFHHAMADGAALITTLDRLMADLPGADDAAPAPPRPAAELPRRSVIFLTSLLANLRAWLALPGMLLETLRRFRAVDVHRGTATVDAPRTMNGAPACVLNRSESADRVFGRTRLPLADAQAVKRAAGTTLSDVVLAAIAGALRAYLLPRGELPEGPLVVNVPVANDQPGAPPRQWSNVFANYFAFLATDVADPAARLAAVAAANAEAKAQLEIQGRHTLPAWLDRIPPCVAQPASRAMNRRARRHATEPDFNLLVSNVRVPNPSWHLGTRQVEQMFMSGPVADGAGLNITVVGYGDVLHVSVVANPASLDRPD